MRCYRALNLKRKMAETRPRHRKRQVSTRPESEWFVRLIGGLAEPLEIPITLLRLCVDAFELLRSWFDPPPILRVSICQRNDSAVALAAGRYVLPEAAIGNGSLDSEVAVINAVLLF